MRFSAALFLVLVVGSAIAADKYAENYQGQLTNAQDDFTIAGASGTVPIGGIGTEPESSLEWFYNRGATDARGCYILWSTSTTACGALPVSTDDVWLGRGISAGGAPGAGVVTSGQAYAGVGATVASLFFSFNSPRLRCAIAATLPASVTCQGMNQRAADVTPPTNSEILSLTLSAGTATALANNVVLGPIILTGYPAPGTGEYAPGATTWSFSASSRLKIRNSLNFRQTNTALYGSGFGVNLGGVHVGSETAPIQYGNAAFSSVDTFRLAGRGGARNALHATNLDAYNWFTLPTNAAVVAAQASKTGFGFVVETPAILVDPCSYALDGSRCLNGFAASEIQGPNLYIQPLSAATLTDAVVIRNDTTFNATAPFVNITITSRSILFTTSTVYVNAVFHIQTGGALAFCEPINRQIGSGTGANTQGFGNQATTPTAGVSTSQAAATGGSPVALTQAGISFLAPTGFASRQWCAPVATAAYDWFGASFTSVRIINDNAAPSVFLSPVLPAVAKLALTYGPFYSVPVLGNVTITPVTGQDITRPLSLLDQQSYTGNTAGISGAANTFPPATATPRQLGFLLPQTSGLANTLSGNSFVNTYDCSDAVHLAADGTALTAVDTGSQTIRDQSTARCRGHPIPTRFTFFGGVVNVVLSAADGQTVALTQFDSLAIGDGVQASNMTFQGPVHLCGQFHTRANGILNFPAQVSAPVALGSQMPAANRWFGQPITNFPSQRASTTPFALERASAADPTPDFRTATTGLTYTTSLAPLVPVAATLTPACTPISGAPFTAHTAGAGCYPGDYSYLVTGPATAAAVRPYVIQVFCTGTVCGGTDQTVTIVDRGCYTTPPSAVALPLSPGAGSTYQRGVCVSPPSATVAAAPAFVGATEVATYCNSTSITGLQQFPSANQSTVSVGLVLLDRAVTIEGSNVTFAATTVRATAALTVTDVVDQMANFTDILRPSSLVVGGAATLDIAGGTLSTNTLSSLTVSGDGFLAVSGAGVLGAGAFVVNGAAVFSGVTATVNSQAGYTGVGGGRTVLTGTGSITYAGTIQILSSAGANAGVFSQVPTTVNGTLDVQGQYTQTLRNVSVSGAIGTTAAGQLTLTNGASLILNNGSLSSANQGNSQVFRITLGDALSQVIIPANSTSTVTNPALITAVNTTAVGVVVEGTLQSVRTLQLGSVVLVLATNTLVTGTLGGASSTIEVGTPTGVNHTVTLSGNSTIAGTFRLFPNSHIINLGTATVAADTAVDFVAGTTSTNTTAIFNSGTLVLAGAFSPSVNIINSGSINSTGTLTIPAGRNLRLQGGSVFGSQVVINGAVTVESGTNSLIAGAVVNNGVITVNAPATLILTACLTGTGSLVGSGTVIYQGQTGCSVNGNFGGSLVLQGNSTASSGLTIITGFISGNGTIVAGSGYLSINNVNSSSLASLAFSGTPTVGAASAINVLTLSGNVGVNTTAAAGSSLTLGQAVVGIRDPVTFVINSNGVVFSLTSGQINLLSSLLVPAGALFRTAGTVVGGSVQVIGTLQLTGSTTFTNTNVTVVAGGKVNSTATTNQLILSSGSSLFVNANATFGGFVVTVNQAANFTFGGNFTGVTVVNGAGRIFLASNVVVPAGATVTFNGLVVCAPGVVVSTIGSGSVNFVASYSGCAVSGNVQGSPVAGGAGVIVTFIGGNVVLVAGTQLSPSLRIGANTTLIVQPGTNITCPSAALGQQCWIVVSGGGNLTLPFYPVCSNGNIPNFRNISGSCGNGIASSFVTGLGVVLYFEGDATTGLLAVFYMVSGNANNQTLTTQDLPTYPIGTVDQLVLTATAHTVVVTTGNNLNPLIVRNRLVLGGLLEVRTLTFVPLRPVVIMRLANYNSTNVITGGFSRVVVTHDQSRSSHNFAWNVGFPTVRVVANDVILDPNGNGNSAAGVVPSFVVALFAVLAAFLFRN